MLIKAEQKFIRISPRKVRLVANTIRGLSLQDSRHQLENINKRASVPLRKTLQQAVSNAVNNHGLKQETLSIKEIQIGEGSTFKRWQPVSRGRAHSIFKRTSHIKIILEAEEAGSSPPAKPRPSKKTAKLAKDTKTTAKKTPKTKVNKQSASTKRRK